MLKRKRRHGLKLKPRHRRKRWNALTLALIATLALLFAFSGVRLVTILMDYKIAADINNTVKDAAVQMPQTEAEAASPYLAVDHRLLTEMNDDYIGWIDIPDTNISYPVVYAADYDEYIYTSFQKEYLRSGTLFIDYACNADWTSRSTVIYGHRMNDGSMLGTLKNYFEDSYAKKHREIHIYKEGEVHIYEVFSVYRAVAADESYTVHFENDAAFLAWIETVQDKSWVDMDVEIGAADRVVMLSTCRGGDENDDRTVVFAVLSKTLGVD